MSTTEKNLHRDWIQQLQPVGLVVAPTTLDDQGFTLNKNVSEERELLRSLLTIEHVSVEREGRNVVRLPKAQHERFFKELLGWSDRRFTLLSGDQIDDQSQLSYRVPEYAKPLRPTYALYERAQSATPVYDPLAFGAPIKTEPLKPYSELTPHLLISYVETPLDEKMSLKGEWDETHHNRLERLLRELQVPLGLLMNEESLRVVYAPLGESSGHMTFMFEHLIEPSGRDLLSALLMLFAPNKLITSERSLHKALSLSRKHQNTVSTKLSKQVLNAFWALLRGFEAAHSQRGEEAAQESFQKLAKESPHVLYEGTLTMIMRLLFLIYAEEEGLIQGGSIYSEGYSVLELFQRLERDASQYQEAMEERRGAWAQLLSLTRMIFNGCTYEDSKLSFKLPKRLGELFDPDRFCFLEGRPTGSSYTAPEFRVISAPPISDACLHKVLSNLLILKGERLSYRALGVEEIGSVYESMMGYEVQRATGPSMALMPYDVVVNLTELQACTPDDRLTWLKNEAKFFEKNPPTNAQVRAIKSAQNVSALFEALKPKMSERVEVMLVEGSLYLQPGEERRKTGSHYTPRSLSAPVVARALEPHLNKINDLPPAQRAQAILELKVCDPAMGSGAFLVEACRQLGDALVEVWRLTGTLTKEAGQEEALLKARRAVAQRCLYGVDKNPYAVSLAKLSLWLFTLSQGEEFTFLDHCLKCGDSLVGLSNEALRKLTWEQKQKKAADPRGELDFTLGAITQAIDLRLALLGSKAKSYADQERMYQEASQAVAELKIIADTITATFFMGSKDADRKKNLHEAKKHINIWIQAVDTEKSKAFNSLRALNQGVKTSTFHWELEFPEVFSKNNGFDIFIGNPPFVGGRRTTTVYGEAYRDWLSEQYVDSSSNADLSSFFVRRCFELTKPKGTLGLIATNTISQGDTRNSGLTYLCVKEGAYIYNAIKRKLWPGTAAVVVSTLHLSKGKPYVKKVLLDGREVHAISSFLTIGDKHQDPQRLKENSGKSFVGSYVLGMGFTFADTNKSTPYHQTGASAKGTPSFVSDIETLKELDPKNEDLIFPYIGGSELNSHPEHKPHRYVINFGNRTLEEAQEYPHLLGIIERKVKPERDKVKRKAHKERWWIYGDHRPGLYQAIKGMDRVLFNSQVSTHMTFAFLPTNYVYASYGYVYPLQTNAAFCALQNRLHEVWALTFSSSLGDALRYTPTDCFETFPFPKDYEQNEALESAGKAYYERRAMLMANSAFREKQGMDPKPEGMTDTYNHFHNQAYDHTPGIIELRELHAQMDQAMVKAYGWSDLTLEYDWVDHYSGLRLEERLQELREEENVEERDLSRHLKPRWTFTPETKDEVMSRLLALNVERAEEEAGTKQRKGSKKPAVKDLNAEKAPRTGSKQTKANQKNQAKPIV